MEKPRRTRYPKSIINVQLKRAHRPRTVTEETQNRNTKVELHYIRWKEYAMRPKVQNILDAALFSALTAAGALISIPLPFSPVPITMQTLFTYLAGALLGGYLGALSQLIYVLMGIVGLPVFAGGNAGFVVLIGPTGGYLLGFVLGSFTIGKLVKIKKNPSFQWLLICMISGTAVIYLLGVLQLMNWTGMGAAEAFAIGVFPFILGDLLKMLVATYITIRIQKVLTK